MATMFPSEVENFTTPGEGATWFFLRQAARPHAEFLAWYSPDIEDREPDFILLSPDCGLIVLEVKDWLVDQLAEADPKTVRLRLGNRQERRKQPLAQAREYVNSLLSLLSKTAPRMHDGKAQLPCPITWGAVLPHISREELRTAGLHKVMDENRVLCWDDIHADSVLLKDASGQSFRRWLAERFPPLFPFSLSQEQLDWLRSLIFPVVRLDLPQRAGMPSAQGETIRALDHAQENLARTFGPGRRLIRGPSGSGKTLILAHQAWHLPRVDRRIKRILVTCFNLSLTGYIRRLLARKGVALGPEGVEVIPMYALCERILGEPLAHAHEQGDYYRLVVQETLDRLDGAHPLQGHWDAVLVDEGQDFSPAMAQVLLRLLPPHGTLTVAQDENQCLYTTGGWESMHIEGLRQHCLKRQYRNSRPIAALAARLLDEAPLPEHLAGADGPEPQWLRSAHAAAQIADVTDAVARLVGKGVPMSEIALLYVSGKLEKTNASSSLPEALLAALEGRGVLAAWAARDAHSKRAYDITTDTVTISTIHSAKGLDFAHVFLLGLDMLRADDPKAQRLAYVGMTRARESLTLAVLASSGLAGALQNKGQGRAS